MGTRRNASAPAAARFHRHGRVPRTIARAGVGRLVCTRNRSLPRAGGETVAYQRQDVTPFEHGAARLAPVLAVSRAGLESNANTKKAPRFPEGPFLAVEGGYFFVSSSARWKNRARPVMRRVIFTACASGSLNAAFSSVAIVSLSLPVRNR